MRVNWPKIAILGVLTVGLATSAAMSWSRPGVETLLGHRVEQVAQAYSILDFDIAVSGRDVSVTGLSTDPQGFKQFLNKATQAQGVRSIVSHVEIAPRAEPYPFVIRKEPRGLFLSGGVPDEQTRRMLAARTGADVRGLTLLSGYPAKEQWLELVRQGLAYADSLSEGEVRLENLDMAVDGVARSEKDYELLLADMRSASSQSAGKLELSMQPPVQKPYFWNASYDGVKVIMSGYAPSIEAINSIKTALPADIPVRSAVRPASGAPQDFVRLARGLVGAFPLVDKGDAHITNADLRFNGAPSTPENTRLISVKLAALGANWALLPPRVDGFQLGGELRNGHLRLTGFASDRALLAELGQRPNTNMHGVRLARGATAGFSNRIRTAMAAMDQLESGSFQVDAGGIQLSGQAIDGAAYERLQSIAAKANAAGTRIRLAQIEVPIADPYTFSANKGKSGTVVLKGHVPSAQAQMALRESGGKQLLDATELARGAPERFLVEAQKGLTLLQDLSEGDLIYDGEHWSLTGLASTAREAERLRGKISSANLSATGWKTEIGPGQPAQQAVQNASADPYLIEAEKTGDGAILLSGFMPSDRLQKFIAVHVGDKLQDETAIASGEPANFIENLLRTVNALDVLETGKGGFDGKTWTLKGRAASESARQSALLVLGIEGSASKAGSLNDWQTDISVPDTEAKANKPPAQPVAQTTGQQPAKPAITTQMGDTAQGQGEPAAEAGSADAATSSAIEAPDQAKAVGSDTGLSNGSATDISEAQNKSTTQAQPSATTEPESHSFFAFKARGQSIALSGDVPTQAARAYLGVVAGGVSTQRLNVASFAPEPFNQTAAAMMRALTEMQFGQVSFKNGVWHISGEALTQSDIDNVQSTLAMLPGGQSFDLAIKAAPAIAVCQEKIDAFDERNAILFRPGSDRLTEESQREVDELAQLLQLCPAAKVSVEGHTDSDGDAASNLALSVARAESVVDALIERGVQAGRLYAIGYGETLPVASNDTAAGKRANRRIVVKVSTTAP